MGDTLRIPADPLNMAPNMPDSTETDDENRGAPQATIDATDTRPTDTRPRSRNSFDVADLYGGYTRTLAPTVRAVQESLDSGAARARFME